MLTSQRKWQCGKDLETFRDQDYLGCEKRQLNDYLITIHFQILKGDHKDDKEQLLSTATIHRVRGIVFCGNFASVRWLIERTSFLDTVLLEPPKGQTRSISWPNRQRCP